MTDPDLDKYFPRATRQQRIAIQAYHASGWTIEPMLPNSDRVEIHRQEFQDFTAYAWIQPNGHVISI